VETSDLSSLWRRLRAHEDSLREHNERLEDVEKAMTELVRKLDPVLTDYAYAKRRREDGQKERAGWRIWLAFAGGGILGAIVVAESIIGIVKALI
jgi:hypothetical protein